MNVPFIYKRLAEDSNVVEILGWPFDFEICEPYLLSSNWPISLSEELIVLAEDGSGGVYTLQENTDPEKSSVIFLSSEGQAGKVAADFTEFLAIMIALPYWCDLLKFSAGGKLEEMRKAVPFLGEEIIEDEPEIRSKQELISKALNLPSLGDPVRTLFNSVKSGMAIEVKADDGTSYDGLFNTFSVSDNRSWQR